MGCISPNKQSDTNQYTKTKSISASKSIFKLKSSSKHTLVGYQTHKRHENKLIS